MTGTIKLTETEITQQLDDQIKLWIQDNVFKGSVIVTAVTRGAQDVHVGNNVYKPRVYYDVTFQGVLDALAEAKQKGKV